jgi:hypothetical protein
VDIGLDSTTSSSILYSGNWYRDVVLIILQISCWGSVDPCTNADVELAREQLQTSMNLPLQVTKIDYLVGKKCACGTNVVTHAG